MAEIIGHERGAATGAENRLTPTVRKKAAERRGTGEGFRRGGRNAIPTGRGRLRRPDRKTRVDQGEVKKKEEPYPHSRKTKSGYAWSGTGGVVETSRQKRSRPERPPEGGPNRSGAETTSAYTASHVTTGPGKGEGSVVVREGRPCLEGAPKTLGEERAVSKGAGWGITPVESTRAKGISRS